MSNYKPLKLIIQYLLFIGILMNILFIPVYQNICFASDDNFEIVEIDWKGNQEEDDDKKVVFQVSIVHNVLFLGYSKLLFEIRSNIQNIIHLEIPSPPPDVLI
jgi:hypothetical protein|tara:strand:- start:279 stop:587 length:309 start_codon:yes stop_codon:yes gene_type:complete